MARDYKHRAQPRRADPPAGRWLWFLAGLLVGVFGTGLLWLEFGALEEGERWIGARPEPEPAPLANERGNKPPKPKFDFYNLLPEMEVIIPDDEFDSVDSGVDSRVEPKVEPGVQAPGQAAPNVASSPPPETRPGRYMVQVASFRKAAEAERLKAQLALLGFETHVQRGKGADGVWHRVRTGPFASAGEVREIRNRLADHGLKGYVVRLSGP
jgi:hypothetical protein